MSENRERPLVPDPARDVVLDAKGLRALAHPVRVQLIGLLRKYGPSTATLLAERTGLTSGATSYHLRQLGAAGFVEEDTGRGNARERWWRSVYQSTWFDDLDLARREPEATAAYLQSVATAHMMLLQQTLNELQAMPTEWQEAFDMSDHVFRLTAEEASRLKRELTEVIVRYRRDSPEEAATAPPGARRISLTTHLLPELAVPIKPPASDPAAPGDAAPADRP
jgi:DNA-binding transcriptional ArsR family regulator